MTSLGQSGYSLGFTYDALGRQLTQTGPHGTISSAFDLAGRRTRLTYSDNFYVDYDYLVTGEMTKIRENGASSGLGVLATLAYDPLGRRSSLTRGSGLVTNYSYDAVSRPTSIAHNFGGNGNDINFTMTYNPASQIVSRGGAHNLYLWTGHGNGSTASSANGLNQLTAAGSASVSHDARGNTNVIGSASFAYTSDNLMTSGNGASLYYDPLDRLRYVAGGAGEQRVYDGTDEIVEYDTNGTTLLRRHVFGPGGDEPLVWYDGSGTSDRRWLIADERGSIVGAFDSNGNGLGYRAYDEYGGTQDSWGNAGRFGYTGQAWLPELGMYNYKARIYWPGGGRFMQTDPIGYGAGMNLYAYVRGDPVNFTDPFGLSDGDGGDIVVCGGITDPKSGKCVSHMSLIGGGVYYGGVGRGPAMIFGGDGGGGQGGEPGSRPLSGIEKKLFMCHGLDPAILDRIQLYDSMTSPVAELVYMGSNARAVTLYSDIYYRRGAPAINSIFSLDRIGEPMRTLAEEVGHVLQSTQGMSLTNYILDYFRNGASYDKSTYEQIAKEFANSVVNDFRSGKCTGQYATPAE